MSNLYFMLGKLKVSTFSYPSDLKMYLITWAHGHVETRDFSRGFLMSR